MDKLAIRVMNGMDWDRSGFIIVDLKNPFHSQAIQLYSEQDEEMTAQLYFLPNNHVQVKFAAEHIPAHGSKCYFLKNRDPHAQFAFPSEGLLDGNNYYLENDVVRIVTEVSGTLTLMEKRPVPEDPTKFKVTAMGEELSEGSIWAGERFLSYPLLFQIQLNHQIAQINHVHSVLQEAHDYFGELQLSLSCKTESTKDISIETRISLIKGTNPIIQLHVDCTYPFRTSLEFLFPVLPEKATAKIYSTDLLIALWDSESTRGLGFLLKDLPYKLIASDVDSKRNQLLLSVPSPQNIHQKELVHRSFTFAILPLGDWDTSVDPPIDPILMRWIQEYYSPLQWHIEE